jgi:hypothetical protein
MQFVDNVHHKLMAAEKFPILGIVPSILELTLGAIDALVSLVALVVIGLITPFIAPFTKTGNDKAKEWFNKISEHLSHTGGFILQSMVSIATLTLFAPGRNFRSNDSGFYYRQ